MHWMSSQIQAELVRTGRKNAVKIALLHLRFTLRLYKPLDFRVQKIGDKIVKWSQTTCLREALAMEFVRQNTKVPVPRVFDVLQKDGRTYIVMEYITGKMLASVWSELTTEQKTDVLYQLKEHMKELRSLQPTRPGRVETIEGSACFDSRLGPNLDSYDSVEAFQERLGYKYVPVQYLQYQEAFSRVANKKYKTVFTHGDFCLHNVLVRDNKVVAIIDWEFAGWWPEYWEYTQGVASNYRYPEFKEMLKRGDVIDAYPDELETERILGTIFTRV